MIRLFYSRQSAVVLSLACVFMLTACDDDKDAPPNTAPVAANDELEKAFEEQVIIPYDEVLSNDLDPDGQDIAITTMANIENATLQFTADGISVTNASSTEPVSFSYTLTDGRLSSDAKVTINWTSSNDLDDINDDDGVDDPTSYPIQLTANLVEFDTVELTWTDYFGSEIEFMVERRIKGETEFQLIDRTGQDTAIYTSYDLTQGTSYEYRVLVRFSDDTTLQSNNVEVTSEVLTDDELFKRKCSGCHTKDGKGVPPGTDILKPNNYDELFARIDKSSFSRCKAEGGCAEKLTLYVLENVFGVVP